MLCSILIFIPFLEYSTIANSYKLEFVVYTRITNRVTQNTCESKTDKIPTDSVLRVHLVYFQSTLVFPKVRCRLEKHNKREVRRRNALSCHVTKVFKKNSGIICGGMSTICRSYGNHCMEIFKQCFQCHRFRSYHDITGCNEA